jgi:hypothetical protein
MSSISHALSVHFPSTSDEPAGSAALAHWSPDELHQFAALFHRMVDDFLAYDAEYQPGQPAI